MTATEFRAWLDANFPGHDQRGRHYGKESAAAFLGLTPRSVQRKRDGKQPITARDELLIRRASGDELLPPIPIINQNGYTEYVDTPGVAEFKRRLFLSGGR